MYVIWFDQDHRDELTLLPCSKQANFIFCHDFYMDLQKMNVLFLTRSIKKAFRKTNRFCIKQEVTTADR